MADPVTIDHALDLMLNGFATEAARVLEEATKDNGDQFSSATLGCAYAIQNERGKARPLLLVGNEQAQASVIAMRSTGLAYLAMRDGDMEMFKELMEKARQADPSLPLPWFSLGLFYQWQNMDFEHARENLQAALNIKPDSHLIHRHLIGLEASTGNLERARILLHSLPKTLHGKGAPITLPLMLWFASTPLNGRLVLILMIALMFVPFLGPIMVMSWLILSIVTYRQLLRVSIRLAVLPGFYLIAMLGAILLKWLVSGSVFP